MKPDTEGYAKSENGHKLYDLDVIRSITGDNIDFLNQVVALFVNTIGQDLATLKEKAKAGQWVEVGKIAHKIKSPLSQFGISAGGVIGNLEMQDGFSCDELNLFIDGLDELISEVIIDLKKEFPGNG